MYLTLPADLENQIQHSIASGFFPSSDTMIEQALRGFIHDYGQGLLMQQRAGQAADHPETLIDGEKALEDLRHTYRLGD
jgi:Arc/MetJ-type ribon-helix-helix transcriptional regulator